MSAERKPTPRDFPQLSTVRRWHEIYRGTWPPRTPGVCPVCRLAMDPRLVQRHAKACQRRKRLAPELWREWHADMHAPPERETPRSSGALSGENADT